MNSESIMMGAMGALVFGCLILGATLWSGARWYRGLTDDQKGYLKVGVEGLALIGLLVLWSGAATYTFARYYEARFISDEDYKFSGFVSVDVLNSWFEEDSEACNALEKERKVNHSHIANGKVYCNYLYTNEWELLPFRISENKTEVLLRSVPWPKIYEVNMPIDLTHKIGG